MTNEQTAARTLVDYVAAGALVEDIEELAVAIGVSGRAIAAVGAKPRHARSSSDRRKRRAAKVARRQNRGR